MSELLINELLRDTEHRRPTEFLTIVKTVKKNNPDYDISKYWNAHTIKRLIDGAQKCYGDYFIPEINALFELDRLFTVPVPGNVPMHVNIAYHGMSRYGASYFNVDTLRKDDAVPDLIDSSEDGPPELESVHTEEELKPHVCVKIPDLADSSEGEEEEEEDPLPLPSLSEFRRATRTQPLPSLSEFKVSDLEGGSLYFIKN